MSVTHKQIYEIDRININERIDQVQNFISISRSFSVKVHGHLKILVHLVNNLIDSDDNLELVDTTLKMPDVSKEKKTQQTVVTHFQSTEERPDSSHANPEVSRLIDNFRSEYQKIKDSIDQGQQNTVFIKEIFGKLLDQLAKNDEPKESLPPKIINKIQCPHCDKNQQGNCQHQYFNPPFPNPNQHYSVYVPHTYQQPEERDNNMNSARSLQNDIRELAEELRRKKEGQRDKEDNSTIKKLLQEKAELEDMLKDKDRHIEELIDELETSSYTVIDLKKSVNELIANNRNLEKVVRDLLEEKQVEVIDPEKEEIEQSRQHYKNLADDLQTERDLLKRKLDSLQGKLQDAKKSIQNGIQAENENLKLENDDLKNTLDKLKNINSQLQSKNKALENQQQNKMNQGYNDDNPTYNHTDFLKCMYAQAHHIENTQFSNNRKSYFSQI